MKYIKYIIFLFIIFVLFFVNNSSVSAATCYTNTSSGAWSLCNINPDTLLPENCVNTGGGGSQEAYECCLSAGTSTCEAPIGGGGPASCRNATVNCPAGSDAALNQPLYTVCQQDFGGAFCNPYGTAQRITGCCSNTVTNGNGDEVCVNGNYEYTTYNCCGASDQSQCTTVATNTYNVYLPAVIYTPPVGYACTTDSVLSSYTTNCREIQYGANWVEICDRVVTCQTLQTTCVCIPSCVSSAPSAPSLITPANGSTVATQQVTLSWNTSSQTWGVGCPVNNNHYNIYIGTTANNLSLVGSLSSGSSSTNFFGISGTTYYWRIDASNGPLTASSPVWSFTINVPPSITTPWWQVKDGDVTASNGSIQSSVPTASYFNLDGTGTFPGVPVYSGGLSYNPGLLSSKNWSANTTTTQGRIFDYTYFKNLIPDDITPTTNSNLLTSSGFSADGYEWFKITGNLSLNAIDFGTRKVILFVEGGNLTLNGNLNVTDGSGFLGVFVDGNITVRPTVTGVSALEGIYLSDGVFTSEVAATRLHVRGSVASYGGITLGRNLVDDSTSAELFEYAPDQILLFPKKLAYRRTKWAEIAP